MRLIRDPPHSGPVIGIYFAGREEERPCIIFVPPPGYSTLRYLFLLLLLKIHGCGICLARLRLKQTPEEHQRLIVSLYLHLRFEQDIATIAYVGDKQGGVVLSHSVLPTPRVCVYLRPGIGISAHQFACVIHSPQDNESAKGYFKLQEPKERVCLASKKGFLIHALTIARSILQWTTPIPKDVIALPEIKKEDNKK